MPRSDVSGHPSSGAVSVPFGERLLRAGRDGVRRVLRPFRRPEGELWDRAAGVRTERVAHPHELTVAAGSAADGRPHVPTPPRLVRSWLDRLPDSAVDTATFVDLGSGLGRVLLMASERPFAHVVGVEFTRELHTAAENNIRRFPAARRRCPDVRSELGDAGAFAFPDGPLVVHLADPFGEAVMARVLDNLGRAHAAAPRPIVVVHQQLRYGTATGNLDLLDGAGFLTGRTLQFSWRDLPHLSSYLVRVHTSPEAAHLRS